MKKFVFATAALILLAGPAAAQWGQQQYRGGYGHGYGQRHGYGKDLNRHRRWDNDGYGRHRGYRRHHRGYYGGYGRNGW